ncbi:hypothetical protein TIFTF001_016134 [Ficus carica]|uniref:non-specific serine/threonine protein kinase n=1 Tax=Ficus carica TaxID=3494 RepID=A0AA88AN18_FICCA|nr:hypothetical protein TIFTF001_016134 [Ficus carica]
MRVSGAPHLVILSLLLLNMLNYIGSCGISGSIPSTFANLRNLVTVWAPDLELTGRIPDFIGNWTKLTTLRLQGNSFEGSIPMTFSHMTSLKELRLSDILNGSSSSLAFIKDMKSLNILVLRNNRISDSIPADIGDYKNLEHLFLGNNNLNGTLPQQKINSLLNIDVSYNNLLGTLPSWVNGKDLQLNLVSNNFTLDSSTNSALPSGLNCLQRNFPCNRGDGRYYNLGIKCGGPQITSSNGIVYEKDDETLGPASYFVSSTKRWATARLSASSLRYYGLGLENGNYIVILQFAEIAFANSLTWTNHGRRVFDIFIQSNPNPKSLIITAAAAATIAILPKNESRNFDELSLSPYRRNPRNVHALEFAIELGKVELPTMEIVCEAFEAAATATLSKIEEACIIYRPHHCRIARSSKNFCSHRQRVTRSPELLQSSVVKKKNSELVIKDFDIRKEAGGVSFQAVQKEFKATVSQNYLEIHLFWAGKGTCCIPNPATYGPIISTISATPGKSVP